MSLIYRSYGFSDDLSLAAFSEIEAILQYQEQEREAERLDEIFMQINEQMGVF